MSKNVIFLGSKSLGIGPMAAELKAHGFELVAHGHENGQPPDPLAILSDSANIEPAAQLRDSLKTQSDEGQLPLLVISEDSALQSRLSALRAGADAYFQPPLDPQAIVRRLERLAGVEKDQSAYKVMVVDDDPSQADFAAAILRKSGVEVTTVTESLSILDTLRTFRPELVLMDVYMPDASGVELTTIIREQKDLMDIPIVYLSAEHDPEIQMNALSVGGEDFLTKPIRPKQLIATVRNRVERSRQLAERELPAKRSVSDPALVRKHILELLEQLHSDSAEEGLATGLFYVELDSPLLLLEQINLDGIDQLMSQIQQIGREEVKPLDRVARFGDFCLVLIVRRDFEQELTELAESLRRRVSNRRFQISGRLVNTSVSIGVRLLAPDDQDASKLINEAIRACHDARNSDYSGVRVLRGERAAQSQPHRRMDPDLLERVSETRNLSVVYQPIVPLMEESDSMYQCLLRLRSANGDLLSAAEFIPEVEQTGKILKLDRWMILRAFLQQQQHHDKRMQLFVSQSANSLKDVQRPDWLKERLGKSPHAADRLVLEFPFPDFAFDLRSAEAYLRALRELGFQLSLNCQRELDTLLRNLAHLPVNFVKITENQIRNYPDTWAELVKAAHQGGAKIIVSRIEHPELLGQLWSNGVEFIQGNFIQHPSLELNYDFAGAVLG